MRKINVRAVFASALIACFCAAYAQASDTGLIRVVPGYHEAVSAPHVKQPGPIAKTLAEPTPRDQMYVFWLVGKALSYPVDKVETYVRNTLRRGLKKQPRVFTVTSTPNPFDAVDLSQIPPAPPVVMGAAAIPKR